LIEPGHSLVTTTFDLKIKVRKDILILGGHIIISVGVNSEVELELCTLSTYLEQLYLMQGIM